MVMLQMSKNIHFMKIFYIFSVCNLENTLQIFRALSASRPRRKRAHSSDKIEFRPYHLNTQVCLNCA